MFFAFFAGADVTRLLSDDDIVTGSLIDLLTVVIDCGGGVTKSPFFVLLSSRRTIILRLVLSLPERKIGQFHCVTNCEVR